MVTTRWMMAVLGGLLAVGCSGTHDTRVEKSSIADQSAHSRAIGDDEDDDEDDEDGDEDIALSEVPDAVKAAAIAAVPGLVLTSAEKETENGVLLYSLSGTANGESYEVEVKPDGTVLEIESGDDDDD